MSTQPKKQNSNGSCAIWAFLGMIIGVSLLSLFPDALSLERPPLFPPADGLVKMDSMHALEDRFGLTPPVVQDDTVGNIERIGFYRDGGPFSKNTILAVYEKDDRRTLEVSYQTKKTLNQIKREYDHLEKEKVDLNGSEGYLFQLQKTAETCTPKTETLPMTCPISKVLFFEKRGYLISLAVDGGALSEGELIRVARDLSK